MFQKLRTSQEQSPGWNSGKKSFKKLFNPCSQIETYMYYKDLLELAVSSGAGRVLSKLVSFADTVLTVSSIFAYRWMK